MSDKKIEQLEMKYFVLKPKAKAKDDICAEASQNAMSAYAQVIRDKHPAWAKEIDTWAQREAIRQQRGLRELPQEGEKPVCETCGDTRIIEWTSYKGDKVSINWTQGKAKCPACSQPPTTHTPDCNFQLDGAACNCGYQKPKHITPKPERFLRPATKDKCGKCWGNGHLIDSCEHCGGTGKEPKGEAKLNCPRCSAKIHRETDFCPNCGSRVAEARLKREIDRLEAENKQLKAAHADNCVADLPHGFCTCGLAGLVKDCNEKPKGETFNIRHWLTVSLPGCLPSDRLCKEAVKCLDRLETESEKGKEGIISLAKEVNRLEAQLTTVRSGNTYLREAVEKWKLKAIRAQDEIDRLEAELAEAKQNAEYLESALRQKKAAFDGCRNENRRWKVLLATAQEVNDELAESGVNAEAAYKVEIAELKERLNQCKS